MRLKSLNVLQDLINSNSMFNVIKKECIQNKQSERKISDINTSSNLSLYKNKQYKKFTKLKINDFILINYNLIENDPFYIGEIKSNNNDNIKILKINHIILIIILKINIKRI